MLFKILFVLLSLLGVGLPFDTVWHYLYALIITFVLVYGIRRNSILIKYMVAGCCFLLSAYFVPKIEIIEQSRLLVENAKVFSPQEFINNMSKYPFSQTADGYVQGLGLSRKVRDVALFNRPWCLRSGYVNRGEYNFYGPSPNLSRTCLPFVVCFQITQSLVERGLNGQGIFYYKNQFISMPEQKNIVFDATDIGNYFYAFGADATQPPSQSFPYLVLSLNKSSQDNFWMYSEILLKIAGILLVAYGLFLIPKAHIDIKELLLFLAWSTYLWIMFYKFLWTGLFALGGYDGIIHGGYPYTMLEALSKGDWHTAIQSPEPIFYFMPGMRYVRFFELLIFGDAYPLQVTVLLFTSVIYYRFFKEILNEKWSFFICIITGTGILKYVGLDFHLHIHSLAMLYGEGFAFTCLMGAIVILLKGITSRLAGLSCFGLFAIALSIRPNMLFFVSALAITYFFSTIFGNDTKRNKLINLCGLAPFLLIPLHNLYFGHKFVPLTTASKIPENMPLKPSMYLDGFKSLFGLIGTFEWSQHFIRHFKYSDNAGWIALFLIAINILIAIGHGAKSKVGSLAIACTLGLGMHLCYLADMRYMHPYFVISTVLLLHSIYYFCSKAFTAIKACDSGAT